MNRNWICIALLFIVAPLLLQAETAEPFLGKWALYLDGGAGWLEVRQEDDYIDADLLWYGGSVTPVENVYVAGETLVVTRIRRMVREKNEDGEPTRVQNRTERYQFKFYGDQLVGQQLNPASDGLGVNVSTFTAERIPPLPQAPDLDDIEYGKSIKIFNGKTLDGWELINKERTNGWSVENGVLVNEPVQKEGEPHIHYGNLRTTDTFKDFKLEIKVNIPKGSNSGIYLRGIYEVQVLDSYGKGLDSHHLGAIYSRITPRVSAEKPAGEWQQLVIILKDRHVTVDLNGTRIIDNEPLEGVTGGALTANQFKPGPIYLQGDHGKVMYKDIVLTPIKN